MVGKESIRLRLVTQEAVNKLFDHVSPLKENTESYDNHILYEKIQEKGDQNESINRGR